MDVLLVILDRLVFMVLGVVLCIGFLFGGVIGMMNSSKEMKSWLNDDDGKEIINTWMSINRIVKWIPGYVIGNAIGTKLGNILDEADL